MSAVHIGEDLEGVSRMYVGSEGKPVIEVVNRRDVVHTVVGCTDGYGRTRLHRYVGLGGKRVMQLTGWRHVVHLVVVGAGWERRTWLRPAR